MHVFAVFLNFREALLKMLVTPLLAELEWQRFDDLLDQRNLAAMHRILQLDRPPAGLKERVNYRGTVSDRVTP